MMRLWLESYARPAPAGSGAAMLAASAGVHALLIAVAVVRTAPSPAADASRFALANRVYYLPPPDRVAQQGGVREAIHYIALSPPGPGAGFGPGAIDARKPIGLEPTPLAGDEYRDSITAPAVPRTIGNDTVFTEFQVDSAAVRYENSAAPAYPADLLSQGITGSVKARYVVDTTGFADTATFRVVAATHDGFVAAVRAALPFMRFSPAKMGTRKVAQLVEQEFTFRIALPADTSDTMRVKPPAGSGYESRTPPGARR